MGNLLTTNRISRWLASHPLSNLLNHVFRIWIARAKDPCQRIPSALHNRLAIHDDVEFSSLPIPNNGFNPESLLDHGRETRGLGSIAHSRRTRNDLNLQVSFSYCGGFVISIAQIAAGRMYIEAR